MPTSNISRRDFLRYSGALAAFGFLPFGPTDISLRPPGAVYEFLARCIRCGACIEACPYDTIRAMDITAGAQAHTPYIDPLKTPCYLCQERGPDGKDRPISKYLRCGEACPTGALRKIVNDKEVLAVVPAEMKMGTSMLNRKLCLAWQYDSCGECYYNCPLKDKALLDRPPEFEELAESRSVAPGAVGAISGPGGFGAAGIRPYVDPRHCIGCGMCNHVCPVQEHIAEAHIRRDIKLSLFEERYAGMVRNVIGRAGKGAQLPAVRVTRRP